MQQRKPSGLFRWLLRLPVWLYRLGFGRLLGKRFLLLWHIGRRTGRAHATVLEVVQSDPADGSYVVAAAWGAGCDWVRNLRAHPQTSIAVAGRTIMVHAVELPTEQAAGILSQYAHSNPLAARALAVLFGLPAPNHPGAWDSLAGRIPLIQFSPATIDLERQAP